MGETTMKPFVCIGLFAASIALTGCATRPENIPAAYVSEVTFQNWSCEQLGEESAHLSAAYAQAAAQQESARTNDTVGVIFLGLPVASLSGDNVAPQIANLKGQQEAVRKVMLRKGCTNPQPTLPAGQAPAAQPNAAWPATPAQPAKPGS